MNFKHVFFIGLGVVLIVLGVWMGLYPHNWQNWLGFSQAAYFKYGTNYAFTSGPGPMIETGIGLSTIIGGLWHAHNCHYDGCWNVGKHKINGTPWCNLHEEEGRSRENTDDLLRDILVELRGLKGLMADRNG